MHSTFGPSEKAHVVQAACLGLWADVGHYYGPVMDETGSLVFPSGVLRSDGTFDGARALHEALRASLTWDLSAAHAEESGGFTDEHRCVREHYAHRCAACSCVFIPIAGGEFDGGYILTPRGEAGVGHHEGVAYA